MAMSSNADAHGVAAMGLATMCSAPGNTASNSGAADTALIAKVALPALVRLARARPSPYPPTTTTTTTTAPSPTQA